MERTEDEVNKGQAVEEQEISEVECSEKSVDFNPFLVETILPKLLNLVDTLAEVKELRKICVFWDKMNLEELEDSAIRGELKAIDFQWNDRFATKEEAEKELLEFLEDTRAIPQLFNSFKFNIPESLKVLQAHPTFFSDYPISRVELVNVIHGRMEIFEKIKAAMKYFLCLIGPNLKQIQIIRPIKLYDLNYEKSLNQFEPKIPVWTEPEQELILPKLKKLDFQIPEWFDFFNFSSALGTGNDHLTSLRLPSLPGPDIGSFPGLDPPRMTRLIIRNLGIGSDIALKFSSGLMTLVEKGMKLLHFGMNVESSIDNAETPATLAQNLPHICSNMTLFLTSQASTLLRLDLMLDFFAIRPNPKNEIDAQVGKYGKIQLPIFKVLKDLYLKHDIVLKVEYQDEHTELPISLFKIIHSPPMHFPSLVDVAFGSECSMRALCDYSEPIELAKASKYHFKSLTLHSYSLALMLFGKTYENIEHWNLQVWDLIGSVQEFHGPAKLLNLVEIPWIDSLRELTLFADYLEPIPLESIKLAYLKKLKMLTISDGRFILMESPYEVLKRNLESGKSSELGWDSDWLDFVLLNRDNIWFVLVSEFLNWLSEAKQLNLLYIKFEGMQIREEGIKEEFIRYFPYPVQFEL